jgi:hypothetical protein
MLQWKPQYVLPFFQGLKKCGTNMRLQYPNVWNGCTVWHWQSGWPVCTQKLKWVMRRQSLKNHRRHCMVEYWGFGASVPTSMTCSSLRAGGCDSGIILYTLITVCRSTFEAPFADICLLFAKVKFCPQSEAACKAVLIFTWIWAFRSCVVCFSVSVLVCNRCKQQGFLFGH